MENNNKINKNNGEYKIPLYETYMTVVWTIMKTLES